MSIGIFIMAALTSGVILLIYCYVAHKSSECFLKLATILYNSNWTQMPIDLQKLIIIMIIEAQKPILYGAYAFVNLNLETFIKVNAEIWVIALAITVSIAFICESVEKLTNCRWSDLLTAFWWCSNHSRKSRKEIFPCFGFSSFTSRKSMRFKWGNCGHE